MSNLRSVVMRRRGPAVAPPNNMFERPAGSHPLAAAAQHARYTRAPWPYARFAPRARRLPEVARAVAERRNQVVDALNWLTTTHMGSRCDGR